MPYWSHRTPSRRIVRIKRSRSDFCKEFSWRTSAQLPVWHTLFSGSPMHCYMIYPNTESKKKTYIMRRLDYTIFAHRWFFCYLSNHPLQECWLLGSPSALLTCWTLFLTSYLTLSSSLESKAALLLSIRLRSRRSNLTRTSPAQRIVPQLRHTNGLVVSRHFFFFFSMWNLERVINCFFCKTAHCVENRDFISIASGGDGGSVQFCKCYYYTVWIFRG